MKAPTSMARTVAVDPPDGPLSSCTRQFATAVFNSTARALAAITLLAVASPAVDGKPLACKDIKAAVTIADTTIVSSDVVAAGAFQPPEANFALPADYAGMPAFCRVVGSIKPTPQSDIRFEVWLPEEEWNGRFIQTGNGGAAGSMLYFTMPEPLSRGYAVANTDTGHRGNGGDFAWAAGEPQKLDDYRYRAVHELTRVGKAITERRYGRSPERSYFSGCSTGGRQGLMEAQRFPQDYDAIIAGAPANDWTPLLSLSVLIQQNLGADGLGVEKLPLLKEAAIAACDRKDGIGDRVIAGSDQCAFDPASLVCEGEESADCLGSAEVAAARRIYAGVVDGNGRVLMPGTGPGSELEWAAYTSSVFPIGTSWYRHVVLNEPDWDPATFMVDTHVAYAERADRGRTRATDPDLSRFIEGNGKLLLYHGTTDGLIPVGSTVSYYESVVARLGEEAVENHVKLYLVPGMDHCAGGEGAFMIDWLTALENWDTSGEPPGPLLAAHPGAVSAPEGDSPAASFTRKACPYPQVARYTGGDETEASSFECTQPEN